LAEELPDLLTVEEAARLARVGRTKAYAMAREWRTTGGRSGLPVVDLGRTLRVPRRALEEMIGTNLTAASLRSTRLEATNNTDGSEPKPNMERRAAATPPPPDSRTTGLPASSGRRRQRNKNANRNQLDLFDSPP
jgi:hypothetical protein